MQPLHITNEQQRMNHLQYHTAAFQSSCISLCLTTATAQKYYVKAIRFHFCCFMEQKRYCNIEARSQQCCRRRRHRLRRRRGCYDY